MTTESTSNERAQNENTYSNPNRRELQWNGMQDMLSTLWRSIDALNGYAKEKTMLECVCVCRFGNEKSYKMHFTYHIPKIASLIVFAMTHQFQFYVHYFLCWQIERKPISILETTKKKMKLIKIEFHYHTMKFRSLLRMKSNLFACRRRAHARSTVVVKYGELLVQYHRTCHENAIFFLLKISKPENSLTKIEDMGA